MAAAIRVSIKILEGFRKMLLILFLRALSEPKNTNAKSIHSKAMN